MPHPASHGTAQVHGPEPFHRKRRKGSPGRKVKIRPSSPWMRAKGPPSRRASRSGPQGPPVKGRTPAVPTSMETRENGARDPRGGPLGSDARQSAIPNRFTNVLSSVHTAVHSIRLMAATKRFPERGNNSKSKSLENQLWLILPEGTAIGIRLRHASRETKGLGGLLSNTRTICPWVEDKLGKLRRILHSPPVL